jgi:hypothetical protein
MAAGLGFTATDLFVMVPNTPVTRRWQRQRHAHKAHSYLWVLRRSREQTLRIKYDRTN